MKVIGKNGKAYWTNSKKTYNKWRKENRQLRKDLGKCQDCPKQANVSSFDHTIRIVRCRDCALKQAAMKKRKKDAQKRKSNVLHTTG